MSALATSKEYKSFSFLLVIFSILIKVTSFSSPKTSNSLYSSSSTWTEGVPQHVPSHQILFAASDNGQNYDVPLVGEDINEDSAWKTTLSLESKQHITTLLATCTEQCDLESSSDAAAAKILSSFLESLRNCNSNSDDGAKMPSCCNDIINPLWETIRDDAVKTVQAREPEAGPQLYQNIISQPSLLESIVTIISNEIATELMPATSLKVRFLQMLTQDDTIAIHLDLMAACMKKSDAIATTLDKIDEDSQPTISSLVTSMLFNKGLHALVCYRVGHRLWEANRTGLAYYLQSTVSRIYSADIHPACKMGKGIYLKTGAGIVIGETAHIGDDVIIMQGVTLGGTGKEAGDRHPKVGNGVIIHNDASILGNIKINDGSIISSKSIVTKPVPLLARVSGIPAQIRSYRQIYPNMTSINDYLLYNSLNDDDGFSPSGTSSSFHNSRGSNSRIDCFEQHLLFKYMDKWKDVPIEEGLIKNDF